MRNCDRVDDLVGAGGAVDQIHMAVQQFGQGDTFVDRVAIIAIRSQRALGSADAGLDREVRADILADAIGNFNGHARAVLQAAAPLIGAVI